ncbi:helix-turn-helix domain-containing protein [Facklamia lactis]|uniref:helix-turn-helix domain-containing protein n=1 Tax=Facklamia lactis TaxID=2749967 RepID=UPI0018CCE61C|nr:helix-turn-helix transcriptional regulator [Facklamia lactis]MBG9979571.1 helix-turn-helix transcriptional regulator [Facklamia lactis]
MNIGENIHKYRIIQGCTQEDLAQYLKLNKATISKWENNQSYPNIQYLMPLASFFNVSVDDLLGFEKILSHEERNELFLRLKDQFSVELADEQLAEIQSLCQTYASDDKTLIMLLQYIANQYSLQEDPQLIDFCLHWTDHIMENSYDPVNLELASNFKALFLFYKQDYDTIIESFSPASYKLGIEILLAQSFAIKGQLDKAKEVLQVELYQEISLTLSSLTVMIQLRVGDVQQAIHRGQEMISIFDIKYLHPTCAADLFYEAAKYYMEVDESVALKFLNDYLDCISNFLAIFELHGDQFFDAIDTWLDNIPSGKESPLKYPQVLMNVRASIQEEGVFASLEQSAAYGSILKRLDQFEQVYGNKVD